MTLCCRDAKAHCGAKNLSDQIANLGALRSVRCNATGSQVSILISQVHRHKFTMRLSESSTCLYVLFNEKKNLDVPVSFRLTDVLITKCTFTT